MSSYFTEPSDVDRHAAPETVQTYMINLESELAAERDAVAELQTQAAEDADTIVGLTRKYTAAMFMVERLIDEKGNATAHNSQLLAENRRLKALNHQLNTEYNKTWDVLRTYNPKDIELEYIGFESVEVLDAPNQ